MADKITINLPKDLKKRIEKRIKETNFKSIQEYISYILEQIVSEDFYLRREAYTEEEEKNIKGDDFYSEEDEETLKKNLEDMGYL